MMNSAKVEFCRLERPIELYENERFWIGRGFSKAGLLPTERGPYSTEDGSLGWKTIKEASLALLRGDFPANNNGSKPPCADGKAPSKKRRMRRGWSFHEEGGDEANFYDFDKEDLRMEDEYECSEVKSNGEMVTEDYCGFVSCKGPEDGPTDDGEGWQYFPDFSPQSLSNPNRKRGILDFVRRRKLRRAAVFRPDHFLPRGVYAKCDYCDSGVVNGLSSAMLDALALATLFAHGPNKKLTAAQALPLKSKLVDSLSIGFNCGYSSAQSGVDYDPLTDIVKVKDRMSNFAETCVGKPGSLRKLIDPDVDRNLASALPGRRREMEKYLNDLERLSLARLLVKDIDRYSFKYHCRNGSCSCVQSESSGSSNHDDGEVHNGKGGEGEEDDTRLCKFRLVPCPNKNCAETFSYEHRAEHDAGCGFKPLPCPSACGAMVPRAEMHDHVRDQCVLRRAECPLSKVGCTVVVQAKDISAHLNDHADKHFMLVANRMMEYQELMKEMDARIRTLEERNGQLEAALRRTTAQLASKSETKAVSGEVRKLTKRLGALEGTCKREFKQAQQDRGHVKRGW